MDSIAYRANFLPLTAICRCPISPFAVLREVGACDHSRGSKVWNTKQKVRPTPAQCSPLANKVITACEKHWDANKSNCSGFVNSVAFSLGAPLGGQANAILKHVMEDELWWPVESGVAARDWAEGGYLVIGGLAAQPNGHVVVVVSGPLAHAKYPTAYWGRLGGTGMKNTTLNFSWSTQTRDKVVYRATLIDRT